MTYLYAFMIVAGIELAVLMIIRIVVWMSELHSPVRLLYTGRGLRRLLAPGRSLTSHVYQVQSALSKLRALPKGTDLTEVLNDINDKIGELNLAIFRDHGIVGIEDAFQSLSGRGQKHLQQG
jgi:sensor histidine kinase YesM